MCGGVGCGDCRVGCDDGEVGCGDGLVRCGDGGVKCGDGEVGCCYVSVRCVNTTCIIYDKYQCYITSIVYRVKHNIYSIHHIAIHVPNLQMIVICDVDTA